MDVEKAIETVKKVEKEEKVAKATKHLAVLLIRGTVRVRHDIKKALYILKLRQKQALAVLDDNATNHGLLHKVKDYVAYGYISHETLKALQKRPSIMKNGKPINVFRLPPPKGGFGRKGIKVSFANGGCLGKRTDMDDFLKRMLW
ncbi:MAG: uL30 family ribosomal protein [Candidatus Woesearchaeota archaeon]|nr:uL30 family ribosomal protein [Candidatus Woesearchaeota archaeon]